jgi:predicted RNase H-like nuclease
MAHHVFHGRRDTVVSSAASPTTAYIGIDLAWSDRNQSGAACLLGDRAGATLAEPPALLGDLETIVAYVERHAVAGPAIVAVDAPLLVPNLTGRRPADAALSAAFRRYEAGAHPVNRRLLARDGVVRGERLVALLAARGFRHVERIDAGADGRLVTEVFPHPAMVAIFGLERTLKYKARPGRSTEARLAEWRRYHAYLIALSDADPPLRGHEALVHTEVAALNGRALKAHEDRVDALMCAYIALYAHRWGAARCRTFGDMREGYIFTPVPEW